MFDTLRILSAITVYLPLCVFLLIKQSISRNILLFVYIIIASIVETYGVHGILTKKPNNEVYSFFIMLEVTLLGFYYLIESKSKDIRNVIITAIFAFNYASGCIYLDNVAVFSRFTWVVSALLIGFFGILHETEKMISFDKYERNWISIGIMVYFLPCSVVFGLEPEILKNPANCWIWYIPMGLNVVYHVLMMKGLNKEIPASEESRDLKNKYYVY